MGIRNDHYICLFDQSYTISLLIQYQIELVDLLRLLQLDQTKFDAQVVIAVYGDTCNDYHHEELNEHQYKHI